MSRSYRNSSLTRTLHAAANTLPAPSGTPAENATGDITGWRAGSYAISDAEIAIDAAAGTTVVIPGPVDVLGYSRAAGKWRVLGTLASGASITVTSNNGFAQKVVAVGTYEHLQLRAGGAMSGGTVVVTATPIEVM